MSGTDPLYQPEASQPAEPMALPSPAPGLASPAPQASPVPQAPFGFPFALHPNFWWGIVWCIALVMFTQVPAGVVAGAIIVVVMLVSPNQVAMDDLGDTAELFANPAIQVAIGISVAIAHLLIILFALAALRAVVGRDWTRQVALRRPALSHLALTVAVTPAFILLANATYHIVQKELHFPSFGDVGPALAFVTSIALALAEVGFLVLCLWLIAGEHWHQRLSGGHPAVAVLLSGGLLAAFLGLAIGQYLVLESLLAPLLPGAKSSNMEDLEKLFSRWPPAVAVVLIGVLPGLSEELWCRGFLGRGLVGKHGYVWGVLLTSFLFGAIHLDPCQGTMAMVLGIVLHYVYLMTRSLWVPMLLHFLNNALAVTLTRIEPMREFLRDPGQIPLPVYGLALVLLGAVAWALYQSRARLVSVDGEPAWHPDYPGVAWPPEHSGTRVVRPGLSLLSVLLVVAALAALGVAVSFTSFPG